MEINQIYNMDCLEGMKKLDSNSIDLIVTDPPYGYGFMNKSWDVDVPHFDIWMQCRRVLKPGAFMFVMSAPRLDVLTKMALRLKRVGFRIDFSPIYWTYATGFPKAQNVSKAIDKRLGEKREVIGINEEFKKKVQASVKRGESNFAYGGEYAPNNGLKNPQKIGDITKPATPQAKALDGSYAGFQPKPAVEVIIVAMKPLSEKTHIEQAVRNGKGITWLDDCRIPFVDNKDINDAERFIGVMNRGFGGSQNCYGDGLVNEDFKANKNGRFPANLLVQNKVLGKDSKYFDLDKWAKTLPFLLVPKASKSEKNKGLEINPIDNSDKFNGKFPNSKADKDFKNKHPTVKPIKLMSYLITLGSREGDLILDPFIGSGTTAIAALLLKRNYLGYEDVLEHCKIVDARIDYWRKQINETMDKY